MTYLFQLEVRNLLIVFCSTQLFTPHTTAYPGAVSDRILAPEVHCSYRLVLPAKVASVVVCGAFRCVGMLVVRASGQLGMILTMIDDAGVCTCSIRSRRS